MLLFYYVAMTFPLPDTGVKNGDTECLSDYVVIPGGSGDGSLDAFAHDRFCGVTLGPCVVTAPGGMTCAPTAMAVTSKGHEITRWASFPDIFFPGFVQPFVLNVVTDSDETGTSTDQANRGFFLVYNQTPCLSG